MSQTFTQFVPAAPEAVAAAIASPHGLGTWLCNEARVEKRSGGRLLLDWFGGTRVNAAWHTFAPPQSLAWRLAENGTDPDVQFTLAPESDGTQVTVTANGASAVGPMAKADFWPRALAGLNEFVATGRDLRLLQRPMLGVAPEFNAAEAGATETAAPNGVLMGAPPENSAAGKAGLRRGDRLQRVGDSPITDWSHIGPALDGLKAGDRVDITVLRDGEPLVLSVTLGERPQPALATTAEGVLEAMASNTARCMAELRAAVAGLSDAGAASADGGWSAKQVISHLIASERFGQMWLVYLDGDDAPADWPSSFGIMEEHLISLSADALCGILESDLKFSAGLMRAALAKQPRPPFFRQLAEAAHSTFSHMDEHIAQIRAASAG